jgi:hypothetical protein
MKPDLSKGLQRIFTEGLWDGRGRGGGREDHFLPVPIAKA